jgi:hypothetical protein
VPLSFVIARGDRSEARSGVSHQNDKCSSNILNISFFLVGSKGGPRNENSRDDLNTPQRYRDDGSR